MSYKILFILIIASFSLTAQSDRWQQRAEYTMEIDMDTEKHQYTGKQTLVYYNNSPDALKRVFYHLYYNAFQPGSMMDVRSRTIIDPDRRVGDRISKLKENEYGWHQVKSLTQDGAPLKYEVVGTILEVELAKPLAPGSKTTFQMDWLAQIPAQIRRTGRNNKEGIDYSMTQWYPKMCEYDYQGWHPNPYVGREFYGIWGDFDVKISIDKEYLIGGTGDLQNANQIGHGYETTTDVQRAPGDKLTWHFVGENIHDFAWAADPDYHHNTVKVPDGPWLHFLYQKNDKTEKGWAKLPEYIVPAWKSIEKKFGKYPYNQYTIIQGGDGGMEYPMATLITGHRNFGSLVGVSVHEIMHSWYQMLMGTNEALYAWMDEGFTVYGSNIIMAELFPKEDGADPQKGTYLRYLALAKAGEEEPLTLHADHFNTNAAYAVGAYAKGAVFLHQLSYVIGQDNLDKGLLKYYDEWHFKHPNINDFVRVMEKQSGIELDWYKEYFVHSTRTIDYSIQSVEAAKKKQTKVVLNRIGDFIMPIDLVVEYKDGSKELFNIPLRIMRGNKPQEDQRSKFTLLEDWPWTHPSYEFMIPRKQKDIVSIEIDPTHRMADINKENNIFEITE